VEVEVEEEVVMTIVEVEVGDMVGVVVEVEVEVMIGTKGIRGRCLQQLSGLYFDRKLDYFSPGMLMHG